MEDNDRVERHRQWWDEASKAVGAGEPLCTLDEHFDRACDHLLHMLDGALLLLEHGAHDLGCAIAINVIEESMKIHIGRYRTGDRMITGKNKDPLRNHLSKHILGAMPQMEDFGLLVDSYLSKDRQAELAEAARDGSLINLRNRCIYIAGDRHSLRVPTESVSTDEARETMFFAIGIMDYVCIGETERSQTMMASLAPLVTRLGANAEDEA